MHSQQPPGVVQNWSTLQCSKHDIEQCGYDHAPVTRGRMRTQFPLPHGPPASRGSKVLPPSGSKFLVAQTPWGWDLKTLFRLKIQKKNQKIHDFGHKKRRESFSPHF